MTRSVLGTAATLALTAAMAGTAAAAEPVIAKPPVGSELSTRLTALASADLRSASPAEQAAAISLPAHGPASLMRDGGKLVVEIVVSDHIAERVAGIEAAGAETLHVSRTYQTVTAAVGERALKALAGAAGVEAVNEVLAPIVAGAGDDPQTSAITNCPGSVTSEGDTQLKAADARTQFDVDGTGVKVGVLSDSFDTNAGASTHAADDVASKDLPGPANSCPGRTTPVQVLQDFSGPGQTDEGRAMLQIVHDLAPGANLAYATAFGGETVFADNIRALANAGAKVIVDDVSYFAEPMFQDGIVASAINDVTAQGVAYFSSAANNNIIAGGNDVASWEAPAFRDAASCPAGLPGKSNCMDFDPGPGVDTTYGFTIGAGTAMNPRVIRVNLNWAQPQSGVTTDLDLYVLSGSTLIAASENVNTGPGGKPWEILGLQNTGAAGSIQFAINRDATAGDTGTPRLKLIHMNNGSSASFPTEYTTSAGGDIVGPAIFGHNGAPSAQSVAAVPYNNSAAVEGFSSRGPVTQYFGPVSGTTPAPPLAGPLVLAKPDLAATDGGVTTFFGGAGNRFFGTSAAAPHAAAIAALQLAANPGQTVEQVKSDQRVTAVPVGGFGPVAAGSGLVQATGALTAATTPFPTVTIQSGQGATADTTPAIGFTTTGNPTSVTCSIDGGAGQGCSSPFAPGAPLADGAHTIAVKATDGYLHSATAPAAVTVDTTGPATKIKKGPKQKTDKEKAKFKFSSEAGAKFECKLDKAKFKTCKSPEKFKVGFGKHKFKVRATDALGNAGPVETYKWKREK